ncbi:MAG: TaqI-like C-terminal specificity domain-containing protein, partial [Dehalococcoidales bacterium]|nr:TaqI-like C-terminal specificity domain-containing protein [Dehalococcoidales bacterium]
LLNPGGRMGFITSGKFLKSEYGKRLREIIKENCVVESLVDLSAQQVFGEATTYPAIIILRKAGEDAPLHYTHAPAETDLTKVPLAGIPPITVEQTAIVKGIWPPIAKTDTLMNKLTRNTVPLGELADRVFVGLQTSADKVYILENRGESDNGMIKVYSRSLDKIIELESVLLKPLISGKDVERFVFPLPTHVLLFPYKVSGDTAELIPEEEFSSLYPRCWEYLLENRTNLESRENGKMKHEKWYAFGRTQNLAMHDKLKFAIPRLVHRLEAVLDRGGQFYLDNVDVGGLTLKNTSNDVYVLGLLNSSLLNYYFNRVSVAFRGGFRSANRQYLEPLPIHIVDFSNPAEKSIHDRLVALVERMLELNKRLAPVRDTYGNERDELLREIEKTDREIDSLVYDLYGLTEEERRIVEGESKK